MKKRYVIYTVLCLIIAYILIINIRIVNKNYIDTQSISFGDDTVKIINNEKNIPIIEQDKNYVIKLYDGNLTVYDWENRIVETITVDVSSMREYDKNQFEKGIVVSNIEEIKHIAEDFSE